METRENQKYFEESNRRLLAFTDFENDNGIELCVAIAVYSVRWNLYSHFAMQYSLYHSTNL